MSTETTRTTEDPHARHRAYQALVGRLRDLVHRTVPPGATVAVVSKGDPDLVSLEGRQGWHLPQDDSGGYVGYHPRDSAAAIEALEALRTRGADFLVLPATTRWWLDHYTDFAIHLQRNYESLVDLPETGTIYSLNPAGRLVAQADTAPDGGLERHRRELLAQQIQDLVEHLLPAGQPVVVVDGEGASALQLPGRSTMHLPALRSDRVDRLETLRRQGAAYLVVSRTAFDRWRADDVLRPHVEQHYRCITRQAHVCFLYELLPAEEPVIP
ncbi:hypothetical protein ACI782_22670 [Geodermatophilus sp. SYSU D00703]